MQKTYQQLWDMRPTHRPPNGTCGHIARQRPRPRPSQPPFPAFGLTQLAGPLSTRDLGPSVSRRRLPAPPLLPQSLRTRLAVRPERLLGVVERMGAEADD